MNATLTLDDVIVPSKTYRRGIHSATRELALSRPWKGRWRERFASFKKWARACSEVYELRRVAVIHEGERCGDSGASTIDPDGETIILRGRLSVVTLLHLFAKCRRAQTLRASGHESSAEPLRPGARFDGANAAMARAIDTQGHREAIIWSVNLFKRRFPLSFSRCRFVGGMLYNDGRRDD